MGLRTEERGCYNLRFSSCCPQILLVAHASGSNSKGRNNEQLTYAPYCHHVVDAEGLRNMAMHANLAGLVPPRQLVILLQSTLPLQKVGESKVSRLHQHMIDHLTPETSFLTYKWSCWSKWSLPTHSCVSSIAQAEPFPIVAKSSETERLILFVQILSLLCLVSYISHKIHHLDHL